MFSRLPLFVIGAMLLAGGPSVGAAWEPSAMPPTSEGVLLPLPPVESVELPVTETVSDLKAPDLDASPAPRRFGGPMAGVSRSPLSLKAFWSPAQDFTTQSGELTMSGESLDLAAPLRIEPGNVWLATSGVHWLRLGSSGRLPDTLAEIPDDLWRITAGVMHFRDLDNGYQIGGILNVGSAGDEPFAGLRDMTTNVIGFVNVPYGNRDAWSISLFYSPTSQLPFPIPGVAYLWRPDETLEAKIGIPFAIEYQPSPDYSFSMSYMPLTNVRLIGRRQLGDAWSAYGGYEIANDTYWLADRTEDKERFYLFDQRFALGLERELPFGLRLNFSVAYLFDRQLFQSESFTRERRDEVAVDPGVLGTAAILWSR